MQAEQDDLPVPDMNRRLVRLGSGIVGIAKATLGIDPAPAETVEARRTTCESCPDGLYADGRCDLRKGGCGCRLALKWKVAGERCPRGHW